MSHKYEKLGLISAAPKEREHEKKKEEVKLISSRTSGQAQNENVPETRVYMFGNSKFTDNEGSGMELTKLSVRSKYGNGDVGTYGTTSANCPKPVDELECMEKTLSDNDTLQSLSLQYRCPVAELKRLNNLIQDQDFYALRTIKVPLKSHGYLKELIQKENEAKEKEQLHAKMRKKDLAILQGVDPDSYEDDEDTLYEQGPAAESEALLERTLSIRGAMSSQTNEAKEFLKHMDKDLEKIRQSTRIRMDSLEQVTQSLNCKRIYPLTDNRRKVWFDGTDCGMRWWGIVAVIFVIGLLLPICYVIYYYSIEQGSHHSP